MEERQAELERIRAEEDAKNKEKKVLRIKYHIEPDNKIIEIREPNANKLPADQKQLMKGSITAKEQVDSDGFLKI